MAIKARFDMKAWKNASSLEGVHIHLYGKAQTSPFRKMGHVSITADSVEAAIEKADFVKAFEGAQQIMHGTLDNSPSKESASRQRRDIGNPNGQIHLQGAAHREVLFRCAAPLYIGRSFGYRFFAALRLGYVVLLEPFS